METGRQGDVETLRHEDMDMETSNSKQKHRRFSLICLPFPHRANGSLSFIRLLMKKQTLSVCKRTKLTKQTKLTCPSMRIT
jgi:hypothetical protein